MTIYLYQLWCKSTQDDWFLDSVNPIQVQIKYFDIATQKSKEELDNMGVTLDNPDFENIPCYRVVNSKGELADAYVFGGAGIQQKLLEADGIEVQNGKVDLTKYGMDSLFYHCYK